ncbi:MAG: PaaI family thioesterase [Solirubrobacterales bacterium]
MTAERERFLPPERTISGTLGIEILEWEDGRSTGRIPVTERILQPFGLVHGGAMLTLAETLASHGTWVAVRDEGKLAMGQEINASLLRPITSGHVNGAAVARRRGRTAWVWDVEITDDDGRLCALVRATIAVRAPER